MQRQSSWIPVCAGVLIWAAAAAVSDAQQARVQSVDANGAPIFKVDPFWPKPLPNRWSMQHVTGIHVDHEDHIWFLNREDGKSDMHMACGLCAYLINDQIDHDVVSKGDFGLW